MYFVPYPLSADTFVSAAVRVVLPWSTCPIVPTFTCGLFRSNLALAMVVLQIPYGVVSVTTTRSAGHLSIRASARHTGPCVPRSARAKRPVRQMGNLAADLARQGFHALPLPLSPGNTHPCGHTHPPRWARRVSYRQWPVASTPGWRCGP